jgi:hypothetical protein
MSATLPAPVCQFLRYLPIDEGTLGRFCSAAPKPENGATAKPKFDKTKAADRAFHNSFDTYDEALKDAKANGFKTTRCAHYVRLAIAAGGLQIQPPKSEAAKDFGPKLIVAGFHPVGQKGYIQKPGDVIVYQSIAGHPDGHMQIYDGDEWVSDFTQNSIWPSNTNAAWKKASYTIYRFPD